MGTLDRHGLLRGRFRPPPPVLRPPWTRDLAGLCDGCGDCETGCPEGIIVMDLGLPRVDFGRGACTFCGDCAEACPTGALTRDVQPPWQIVADIGTKCLSLNGVVCRVCEEQCEPAAIRFRLIVGGRALPEINQSDCTGCGACFAACPVQAIEMKEAA